MNGKPLRGRAPCPCTSGLRYGECCGPLHRGDREAADPPALMRSRYSAYALGEVGYLLRTLHPGHPDRARPEAEVLRELRATCTHFKYPRLEVLDWLPAAEGVPARVLFLAHVYEHGKDCSFVERSDFEHDGTGWRYAGGVLVPRREVQGDAARLTLATFPPQGRALT